MLSNERCVKRCWANDLLSHFITIKTRLFKNCSKIIIGKYLFFQEQLEQCPHLKSRGCLSILIHLKLTGCLAMFIHLKLSGCLAMFIH
jgi:hypothetical protein